TADPTSGLVNKVLADVGASSKLNDATCTGGFVSNRDSVDKRIVSEYLAGTSSIPSSQNDKGGFPSLAAGTPSVQALNDGIPDRWKEANGLTVSNATVANQVAPNGYTYLENYLNGTDPNLTASLGATATSGSLAAASLLTGFSDLAQSGGQLGRFTRKD